MHWHMQTILILNNKQVYKHGIGCDICSKSIYQDTLYNCKICGYDVCEICINKCKQ